MNFAVQSFLIFIFTVLNSATAFAADSCEVKIQRLPSRLGVDVMRIFGALCAIILMAASSVKAEPCSIKLDGVPSRFGPFIHTINDVYNPTVVRIVGLVSLPDQDTLKFFLNESEVSLPIGKFQSRGNGIFDTDVDLSAIYSQMAEGTNQLLIRLTCAETVTREVSKSFVWDSVPPKVRVVRGAIRVIEEDEEVSLAQGHNPISPRRFRHGLRARIERLDRSRSISVRDAVGNQTVLRFNQKSQRWQVRKSSSAAPAAAMSAASTAAIPHVESCPSYPPNGAQNCQIRLSVKTPYFAITGNPALTAANRSAAIAVSNRQDKVTAQASKLLATLLHSHGYTPYLGYAGAWDFLLANPHVFAGEWESEVVEIPVDLPPAYANALIPPATIAAGSFLEGRYSNSENRYLTVVPENRFPLWQVLQNSRCANTVEVWVVDEIPGTVVGVANPSRGTVIVEGSRENPESNPWLLGRNAHVLATSWAISWALGIQRRI